METNADASGYDLQNGEPGKITGTCISPLTSGQNITYLSPTTTGWVQALTSITSSTNIQAILLEGWNVATPLRESFRIPPQTFLRIQRAHDRRLVAYLLGPRQALVLVQQLEGSESCAKNTTPLATIPSHGAAISDLRALSLSPWCRYRERLVIVVRLVRLKHI